MTADPRRDVRAARDRAIVRLAVPALATLAVEPLYVLVDTAIVGRLGTAPLGGLALASSVLTTSFFVVRFLEYGVTPRVAYRTGAGDDAAAAGVFAQALWLALALGAALAAMTAWGGRGLASLLGGEGDVLDAATTYLRISAVGVPLLLVSLVAIGFLRGVQDTRTPLWIALGANVVNLVLELVFVYGLDLGVRGSAWSTVIAQAAAATAYALRLAPRLRAAGASFRPDRVELGALLRSGWHLSVRTAALLGTLALATAAAARIGPATLAGHQIALQVETFLALAVDSLAIAGQALVGTALGAGDRAEARATGRRLITIGLLAGTALGVALAASAGILPAVFTEDGDVRDRAMLALLVVGALQVPGAVVFVLDGVLLGAADVAFQGRANVAAFAVFVPLAAAVLALDLGIVALWAGLLGWMTMRMVANLTRFHGERWMASPS